MTTGSPAVQLRNVAAGVNTTDAVNVGQLPGTVTYDSSGQGTVTLGNANAPGGNTSPVDVQNVRNLTATGSVQAGSVQTTGNTDVGGTLTVSNGANFSNKTVSGVAAGALSSTSTDAVNGSQLYATNQNVSAAQATANTALSAAGAAQATANQSLQIGQQNTLQIQAVDSAVFAVNQLVQANICHIVGSSITCGQQAQVLQGNTLADPQNPANAIAATAGATAIGYQAQAKELNSTALGNQAQAGGQGAVAVGANANAAGSDSVALGYLATANGVNSVALGSGSVANRNNSVSVGNAATGLTRQITNVAPGTKGTDAVNVNQLEAVASSLRKQINATGAMAAAMSNIQLPPGYTKGLGVAVGHQGGQNALAIGFVATPEPYLLTRISASISGDKSSVGAGITLGW